MLSQEDLADATVSGYIFDVASFHKWVSNIKKYPVSAEEIDSIDIKAYRQYLIEKTRSKTASVNRRIQSLKRFFNWASQKGIVKTNPAKGVRFMRRSTPTKPKALSKQEVTTILQVSGKSSHGLASRNYALLQVMLQAGLRIGEVVNLQMRDLVIYDRTGSVRIAKGKGNKDRVIPMNATLRRALIRLIQKRESKNPEEFVFLSKRGQALTVRAAQKSVTGIVRRAKIKRISVSAHTLRHTFATNYLKANPEHLRELAELLGHESLDTTAVYTKPSQEDLAETVERSEINIYE